MLLSVLFLERVTANTYVFYYQPLQNNSFLLLHVSANHRGHYQGVTFHRRAQRTVCQ
jgi:hypothetical protein